jgi:hypothetical protein
MRVTCSGIEKWSGVPRESIHREPAVIVSQFTQRSHKADPDFCGIQLEITGNNFNVLYIWGTSEYRSLLHSEICGSLICVTDL